MEFDDFGHGDIEFGDALAPRLLLAVKIVARAVEDQHHARRRVAAIGGQQGGIAFGTPARARAIVGGRFRGGALAPRQGRFRRARPDQPIAREQRHRARVVQHLAERRRVEVVARHPALPLLRREHLAEQSLAALPPPVDLRAEEQVNRPGRLQFQRADELLGRHGRPYHASRIELTTCCATLRLIRSSAASLSSMYERWSAVIS